MSEKALRALVGVVLGLSLVWLAVIFIPRGSSGPAPVPEAVGSFFAGITPDSVTSFRFQGPRGRREIELTPSGDHWTVNGFTADSGAVARLFDVLGNAAVDGLVGTNPANHPRLGVDADSAWSMEVEGGNRSRKILVGKGGARYGTTYIRLPEADEVYLAEGSLRPMVSRDLEGWRSKRVTRADTGAIRTLTVDVGEDRAMLHRQDSVWILDDDQAADSASVRDLLGELARMDASGFYGPQDSLSPAAGFIRATDGSGKTLLYLEVGSGEGDRWVRVEGDSTVYRIPSWRADRLLRTPEDLRGGG